MTLAAPPWCSPSPLIHDRDNMATPTPTPLDLPVAPPAPGVRPRTATLASFQSFDTAMTIEPTIDDLKRDTNEVQAKVTAIEEELGQIEALRDRLISGEAAVIGDLAKLTTETGQRILTLSAPFAAVRQKAATLDKMVQDGRAAATSMEVENVNEEIEVVKLGVAKSVEMVRTLAWEEVQGRAAARIRMEGRIKAENPGMSQEMVDQALKTAEVGAAERISELDQLSYAGRFAAEHPFTELAVLVDILSQLHSEGVGADPSTLERALSDRSRGALQGVHGGSYEKVDNEVNLENAPLAMSGAGNAGAEEEDWVPGAIFKEKSIREKIARNWKDWLVRTVLVLSVLGLVVGLITYETISAANKKDSNSTTTDTSPSRTASVLLF